MQSPFQCLINFSWTMPRGSHFDRDFDLLCFCLLGRAFPQILVWAGVWAYSAGMQTPGTVEGAKYTLYFGQIMLKTHNLTKVGVFCMKLVYWWVVNCNKKTRSKTGRELPLKVFDAVCSFCGVYLPLQSTPHNTADITLYRGLMSLLAGHICYYFALSR